MPLRHANNLCLDRASFSHFVRENIRFSDTDMVGHVNNTAFAVYCEAGRVHFGRSLPIGEDSSQGGVLARVEINMRAEAHFPGVVEIGTGVVRVGRTSFTLGQGLFVDGKCVATAQGVLVTLDDETRRPAPLGDAVRAALVAQLLPGCGED